MQCYAPSKLSWYTVFSVEIHVKKCKKITHELRMFGDMRIRHPGIHMAWVGCGLALNVAELQAMQVTHASMLCKQQTFDKKSCNSSEFALCFRYCL